ncbi:aminotransferase class I/II-fold pyridoxal phosphate-dependent enzyme [bacterium]|jgi:aminotransferase|nr:aminotransferase class I/II-fold pyridoxal phosphate-dependent enzyme [bacterium]
MTADFSQYLESIPSSGIREFFDLVMSSDDIISLGVGEPDFTTPWSIRSEAIYALEKGYTTYTSNEGLLSLRESISNYCQSEWGINYSPETEILVTNGVSEGADIVLRALLNPGDSVILPQPAYVCYDPLIKLTGASVIPVDTSKSNFVPDPKAIESAITDSTKAIVLCYPNNPTGQSIPRDVLEAIAKVAKANDLWVLSDEIYGELSYETEFVSIASLPGMKERTILFNGFSKAYAMTGFRIGYICGPESLISRATKIHQYSALCASIFSQMAAAEALKNGRKAMEEMRQSYQQRRNLFVEGCRKMGLETAMPAGAFYCFPSVKSTGLDSVTFAKRLVKEARVAVVPGPVFGDGGEGHIRCCYAASTEELKEALIRMEVFVKGLK